MVNKKKKKKKEYYMVEKLKLIEILKMNVEGEM